MSGEDRYGAIEDAEAIRAIHRALEAGINCVDTAAGYGFGHAEEVVGQALAGHRNQVVLVTKCGLVQDPGTMIAGVTSPGRISCGKWSPRSAAFVPTSSMST